MTRLEKASSIRTDLSEMEIISCCCPHDFGIEDDSKPYKNGWRCEVPSGCDKCWNREIEGDSDGD